MSTPHIPSYWTAVANPSEVYVYLESTRNDRRSAHGLILDHSGRVISASTPLIESFDRALGEVQATSQGLAMSVIRAEVGDDMLWDLWQWRPGAPASRALRCLLPLATHGQLVEGDGVFIAVFEDRRRRLWAFTIDPAQPACPAVDQRRVLLTGSLPADYTVDWVDRSLFVSGLVGGTYVLHAFDGDLQPARQLRLAAGTAGRAVDMSMASPAGLGPIAMFSGNDPGGAVDLYMAHLEQLSAGPLAAERIVATAEAEVQPRWVDTSMLGMVSWQVMTPWDQGALLMAAPLRLDGTVLRGGEVLWRPEGREHLDWVHVWTSSGLLRLWIDEDGDSPALRIDMFRPSFWPNRR